METTAQTGFLYNIHLCPSIVMKALINIYNGRFTSNLNLDTWQLNDLIHVLATLLLSKDILEYTVQRLGGSRPSLVTVGGEGGGRVRRGNHDQVIQLEIYSTDKLAQLISSSQKFWNKIHRMVLFIFQQINF